MQKILALLLTGAAGLSLAGLAGGASSTARLRITPQFVPRGETMTITGTGFRPSLRVTLRIGRPNSDSTARFGATTAGRRGGFTVKKVLSRSIGAGTWVVLACQRNCRIKATAQFRVPKIKPV